jgi:hypothetical protein
VFTSTGQPVRALKAEQRMVAQVGCALTCRTWVKAGICERIVLSLSMPNIARSSSENRTAPILADVGDDEHEIEPVGHVFAPHGRRAKKSKTF